MSTIYYLCYVGVTSYYMLCVYVCYMFYYIENCGGNAEAQ